ncbi:Deoxyribonuclease-2-beta, partial [Trichinella nelsoni]
LEKSVYRHPNNTAYHVVCKNLLEEAIIEGTINLAVLGYLLLNKIAPLVSPRKTAQMQYFNKLREISTLPLFTSKRSIHNSNAASSQSTDIYTYGDELLHEFNYSLLINIIKKLFQGFEKSAKIIHRLIENPASVTDHDTDLEAYITKWAVLELGNIFPHKNNPYFDKRLFCISYKNQTRESAPQNVRMQPVTPKQTVYKAPGQANGKIIEATAAAQDWQNGAQALSNPNQHSFATALQHVVGNDNNIKFLAYNNAPPGVANVKTKSNSKGVIILATNADSAAWIVHTVPGFPAAKTGYSWPVAENARGHLLICLTISESQINAIAASLLLVQPLIHYNDIPKTETAGMPYFNKLAEGKIPTLPPFTSRQTIQIYKKVIVKVLKKTIKVWSRRDSKLKGDCRGSQRHIRLIKSPAVVVDHNTNLEADITNWAVSNPGNIFCHIDKPYFKNQTREPAMAVCIENNDIFARFDAIAAQLEDCPK